MYQREDLEVYPFFRDVLKDRPVAALLDSLTGVLTREYILDFLHSLIDEQSVFSVAMIDLDNFKSYNDHYGHSVGDQVLSIISDRLMQYVGNRGLVGRFGGDELILILFIGNDYDQVHAFYEGLFNQGNVYSQHSVFRRDYMIGELKLFVSATLGSASFPKDAQDYNTLFAMMDKTLYRGKVKGRNCYIIYVPEKHAHLQISRLNTHGLYDTFVAMAESFDREGSLQERMRLAFQTMKQNLRFHYLFFVDASGQVTDVDRETVIGSCEDLSPMIRDGYFACTDRGNYWDYPKLTALMEPMEIHSILVLPIGQIAEKKGFVLLSPESKTLHIWQDEEYAAGFVLARMIRECM